MIFKITWKHDNITENELKMNKINYFDDNELMYPYTIYQIKKNKNIHYR